MKNNILSCKGVNLIGNTPAKALSLEIHNMI
jgi:hypothetical protein